MRTTRRTRSALHTLASLAACACGGDGLDAQAPTRRALAIEGFEIPESVRHDPRQDVYFVSNVGSGATAKDNNGYISRVRPDGTVEDRRFVAGGRNGVVLHAPKGLWVAGDTLWVTDIDAVRAFDARNGAPLVTVDLAPLGARFLNDVARAPDGTLYVSDSGLEFHADGRVTHPGPDRIFGIDRTGRATVAVESAELDVPNGVTWDSAGGRLLIVSLGGTSVFAWRPGARGVEPVATGPGGFDGIEPLGGGRFLVSSQDSASVEVLDGTRFTRVAGGLPNVGDIGLDRRRGRVLVPLLEAGRVEVWDARGVVR